MWTNIVSSLVQSLMLDSSYFFFLVVSVEAAFIMIQLGSIISYVDGKHWVKDALNFRLVTPLVQLSVDGQLTE